MNCSHLTRRNTNNSLTRFGRCCLTWLMLVGVGAAMADQTPYHQTGLTGSATDADGDYTLTSYVAPTHSYAYSDIVLNLGVAEAGNTTPLLNLTNVPITATASGIPVSITGKSAGTYSYTMFAVIYGQYSGYQQTIDTFTVTVATPTPPPPVPSSISVSPISTSSGSHTASWSSSSGATKYILEQKKGSGSWVQKYSGSSRSKALSGLTIGSYTYRVKACKTASGSDVCSGYKTSSAASIVVPSTPSSFNVPSSITIGQPVPLSWSAVSGATNYVVYRYDLQNTSLPPVLVYSGTGTSASDYDYNNSYNYGGLLPLGAYGYTLVAYTAVGSSAPASGVVTVALPSPPPMPSSISVSPASTSSGNHTASWSASSGATKYILEQKKNSGSWVQKYSGPNRSKALSGLTIGSYTYRVKACKTASGSDVCSGYKTSSAASIVAPPAPSNFNVPAAINVGQPVPLSWSSVSGATSYVVYRYDLQNTSLPPVLAYNGTATSTQDYDYNNSYGYGGLLPPGAYGYTLVAYTAAGASPAASGVVAIVVAPATPSSITIPSGTNYSGSYSVSWGSSSGATDYELQQQIGSGGWVDVPVGNVTSKSFSSIAAGSYKYQVRACKLVSGLTTCSGWRASGTLTVSKPITPANFNVPVNDNNGVYTVSWNASAGASSYTLRRRVNGGGWSNVPLSPANATSKSESVGSGIYEYQVRANSGSGSSLYTIIKRIDVAITPGVPSSITAPSSSYDSHTVSWGTSSGSVTKYELFQQIGNGTWTMEYSGPNQSELLEGLIVGTYKYRVRACNVVGGFTSCSGDRTQSNNTIVNPKPVPVPSFASIESVLESPNLNRVESVGLSWGSVEGADWYNIQSSKNGAGWTLRTLQDPQGNLETDVAATSGSELWFEGMPTGSYRYRIRACNANTCSEYSAPSEDLQVVRAPNAPSIVMESNSNGITKVSWAIIGGSTGDDELEIQFNGGQFDPVSFNASNRNKEFYGLDVGAYAVRVRTCESSFGMTACSEYDEVSFDITSAMQSGAVTAWGGMVSALEQGDIATAVTYFTPHAQERYNPIFNTLSDEISGVVQSFENFTLVSGGADYAVFGLNRNYNGEEHLFFVTIVLDDGSWKIQSM